MPKKPKSKLGRQKRRRPRIPLAPIDNVSDDVLEGTDEEVLDDPRDDARDDAREDIIARNMAPGAPMDAPAPTGELGDGVREASSAMAVDLPAEASQRTLWGCARSRMLGGGARRRAHDARARRASSAHSALCWGWGAMLCAHARVRARPFRCFSRVGHLPVRRVSVEANIGRQ